MTRFLEHAVKFMLHLLPNGIAVRLYHHTSAHSRLFGQICFNDQIVIPLRVILAAFGQIFEFFCHRKLFLFRFVVDT